jgi:16S rRNA (guanine966-N2)-methyltransferase
MSALGGRFDGVRALDLFAGSGALGLELLSRGAEHVTFVEQAGPSLRSLRANIEALGAGVRARVVAMDVFRFLEDPKTRGPLPGLALADPPYGSGLAPRLLRHFADAPFAEVLWVEHASREPLPALGSLTSRRYGDTTLSFVSRAP